MLKYLSKKITLQWIILLALLAFASFTIITKSQIAEATGTPFLFKNFAHLFTQHEFIGKGFVIFILLLQLILIQYYYTKNEYATRNSVLPGCFFLSILLLTNSLIIISPFFFTLFFFLIIISINFTAGPDTLKNNVFLAGILIALSTGFDISSIVLLFLVMATLIINQFYRIKEIGILFFGFFLLYFYFFSFNFFRDTLPEWLLTFQEIKFLGIFNSIIANKGLTLFSSISLGVVYLFFILRFKFSSDTKVVIQRNRIVTLNTRAILMLACIFISSSTFPMALGYLFVHIAIYLAMLSQEKSTFFLNELITILTLVALWLF